MFNFPYMSPHQVPNHPRVVGKWYKNIDRVQPGGPSPAILHVEMLKRIVKGWYELSVELKRDQESDRVFGWYVRSGRACPGHGADVPKRALVAGAAGFWRCGASR